MLRLHYSLFDGRMGSGLAITIACLFIVEALWLATYCGWWVPWWQRYQEVRHGLGFYCTVFGETSVLTNAGGNKILGFAIGTEVRRLEIPE